MAAKHRHTAVVAATLGQVNLRADQIRVANTNANKLIESDSESTDRFHSVTGNAVAKARIVQAAAVRRHPRLTSRPTVQARKPHERAAISAWAARNPLDEPASLISSGVAGGRWPAQNPMLHSDRDAMCT